MGGFKEECATYKIALFLYKRKWYNSSGKYQIQSEKKSSSK